MSYTFILDVWCPNEFFRCISILSRPNVLLLKLTEYIIIIIIYLSKWYSDNIAQYYESSMSQSLRHRKAAHSTNT